jgi:hypothetical protein
VRQALLLAQVPVRAAVHVPAALLLAQRRALGFRITTPISW